MLSIVVGLAAEARIARRLGVVAIGGGSSAGAAAAARGLLERGATALVSFGLAGGLDPRLRPGDVVLPARVLAGGESLATDPLLSRSLARTEREAACCLLAWDRVVATAEEKARLWRDTGAVAVDMESGAVALAAIAAGLPFAVLRVICDAAARDLPPAALAALDHAGGIGLARVALSVLRRPAQVPALLGLARDAAVARRVLAAFGTGERTAVQAKTIASASAAAGVPPRP
jgi:adenosylhomocysteine nucleosidase